MARDMVRVNRITSTRWRNEGLSIEDKINEFLHENITRAAQIRDIKMDFGGSPDADYVAAYIFYVVD